MAEATDSGAMSPLARLLRRRNSEGLTYGEMSRRATRRGLELSVSRISQIANDESKTRLTPGAIAALAVALEEPAKYIAALDDERWGVSAGQNSRPRSKAEVRADIEASDDFTDQEKRALLAMLDAMPPPERPAKAG